MDRHLYLPYDTKLHVRAASLAFFVLPKRKFLRRSSAVLYRVRHNFFSLSVPGSLKGCTDYTITERQGSFCAAEIKHVQYNDNSINYLYLKA